jgi:hypothetical protein
MNAEKLFNDIFLLSNSHTNNDFQIGYFSSPVYSDGQMNVPFLQNEKWSILYD